MEKENENTIHKENNLERKFFLKDKLSSQENSCKWPLIQQARAMKCLLNVSYLPGALKTALNKINIYTINLGV